MIIVSFKEFELLIQVPHFLFTIVLASIGNDAYLKLFNRSVGTYSLQIAFDCVNFIVFSKLLEKISMLVHVLCSRGSVNCSLYFCRCFAFL